MRIEEPELPPLPESGKVYHQFVFAERGSKAYAVLHGDMHIRDGHPIYQIEELPAKLRPSPSDTPNNQPSRLLNARVQTVAFTGRERELEQLISWRDRPRPGISVLLMHGP